MKTETKILLDTHIWIWLINGSSELRKRTAELLDEAGRMGRLFLPVIAIWELATLVAKKRLTLNNPIKEWVSEALLKPGIQLVSLSPDIAVESTILPGNLHGDPADRIIVATARVEKLTLITQDEKIRNYGKQGHVKTMALR